MLFVAGLRLNFKEDLSSQWFGSGSERRDEETRTLRTLLLAPAIVFVAPITKIALTFFLLAASPTHVAFDGNFDGTMVAKIYYDVRWNCRLGQTADGKVLSPSERDRQCRILDALGEQLKAHGYCWNNSEQEWVLCPTRDRIY